MKTEGQRIKQDSLLTLRQVVTFLFLCGTSFSLHPGGGTGALSACPVGGIHLVSLKEEEF